MKFYLNNSACISPQKTFTGEFLEGDFTTQTSGHLLAIEPEYKPYIPLNILRRMGKTSRMGLATGMRLIQDAKVEFDAIISGSSYGSNAESFKFLDQIYKFDEGAMTPTNFVQSTTNIVSAQLGLLSKNYCYNSTNSQKAHSFENSILEAMILMENGISHNVLVGAVDEISIYTFNLFKHLDWVRTDDTTPESAIKNSSNGFVPGESATFFHLSHEKIDDNSIEISFFKTYFEHSSAQIIADLKNLPCQPDLILSPENGDKKSDEAINELLKSFTNTPRISYKKYVGESPTISGFAVWLGQQFLQKNITEFDEIEWNHRHKNILIINRFINGQLSLIMLSK